ncbi:hypothetical protein [Amycolatopsis sp. NPDC006125]|uniref:hypothetical protein n=1 Tax=Amycolatopsis sp. NPDC006125 TaxID=3156730 RepID=UPI0033AC094C
MGGRLDGSDLVLSGEIGAPVEEVRADVTDPERTAGSARGRATARRGRKVWCFAG